MKQIVAMKQIAIECATKARDIIKKKRQEAQRIKNLRIINERKERDKNNFTISFIGMLRKKIDLVFPKN